MNPKLKNDPHTLETDLYGRKKQTMRYSPSIHYLSRILSFSLLVWSLGNVVLHAQGTFDPYALKEIRQESEEEQIRRGDKLKAFTVNKNTGDAIRSDIDTTVTGFYRRRQAEGRALAIGYLGNLHSPWHAKLFFDRNRELPAFFYKTGLEGLIFSPETSLFYDTKAPFAEVLYHRHGESRIRESQLNVRFGANYTPKLNLAADFDYTYSNGYYNSQPTKNFNYRVAGSYRHDRYEAYLAIANDYFHIGENGGIEDERYITRPQDFNLGRSQIRPQDIPVRFPGNVLFNRVRQGSGFLTHRFNLGYYEPVRKEVEGLQKSLTSAQHQSKNKKEEEGEQPTDSLRFVPVGSIVHSFRLTQNRRRFIGVEGVDWTKHYNKAFIYQTKDSGRVLIPNDTTRMQQIDNTLALSLREGFRPWVKFGLTAFARLENRSYHLMDSIGSRAIHTTDYNIYVGGEINRTSGEQLHFKAKGEIAPIGEDAGSLRLEGDIRTQFRIWKHEFGLQAWGHLGNTRPSYLLRHQHGTFHWWDKKLEFTRRLDFGARAKSEWAGLEVGVRTATLQNFIYFGPDAYPIQKKDPIQVFEARVRQKNNWGVFGWEFEAAYQRSTDEKALPLPQVAAYANIFLDFYVAKVMHTQIGVDARYHTAYKAPWYEPATMQFVNQNNVTIGGREPILNAYANVHLKRTRFFLELYNFGDELFTPNRMTLPGYPITPMSFRFGLSVDFNN